MIPGEKALQALNAEVLPEITMAVDQDGSGYRVTIQRRGQEALVKGYDVLAEYTLTEPEYRKLWTVLNMFA